MNVAHVLETTDWKQFHREYAMELLEDVFVLFDSKVLLQYQFAEPAVLEQTKDASGLPPHML